MGRRLIAWGVAAFAAFTMGAFALAAPGNANATTVVCDLPTDVASFVSETETTAKANVSEGIISLRIAKCLDIEYTDKCDGTTVVTMTNFVKDDNDWTVLTVLLNGKEYTLEGGSSPNTETVTVGPQVKDLQAYLVFRGKHNGASWEFKVPFKDAHTWELPDACPTASPSPSATATASPSPSSTVTTAPATTASTTAPPAVAGSNDLPVTGASATIPLLTGAGLVLAAVGGGALLYYRRRKAESAA